MRNLTHWTRAAPIAVFLVLVGFLAVGLTRDPRTIPSELIDRQMPPFALPDLHAPEATVSDMDLIGKVSLVNVFGSWCAACVVEQPVLLSLAQVDGVQMVGVNWRDTAPAALAWLERFGDPFERIAFDEDSELAIELGVTGAPESFIIDRAGRIRFKHVGPITEAQLAEVILPVIARLQQETD